MNDSLFWSPRWRRMARIGDTSLILFDVHTTYEPRPCSKCKSKRAEPPVTSARRFILVEYRELLMCPECGAPVAFYDDITLRTTSDEAEAEQAWADAEAQLIEEAV